jgi:hypothetical protein
MHAQGGMAGWAVITGLRLLGGLALSNDAAAAYTQLAGHASACPSLHAAVVPAATAVGALGSAGLALLLSWVMPTAQLAASGWRVVMVLTLVWHSASGCVRGRVLLPPSTGLTAVQLADQRGAYVWWALR